MTQAIEYYDSNVAGQLTPAGQALVNSGLFTQSQLLALGAYAPLIHGLPENAATATWLKTMDLRLSRPFQVSERVKLEPNLSVFNLFNWANYGGAGNQLSGVMDGAPGTSLNNSSWPGILRRIHYILHRAAGPGSARFGYVCERRAAANRVGCADYFLTKLTPLVIAEKAGFGVRASENFRRLANALNCLEPHDSSPERRCFATRAQSFYLFRR